MNTSLSKQFLAQTIVAILIFVAPISISCSSESLKRVSFVELLVNPAEYTGLRVRVVGFLALDPSLRIFLTRDHAEAVDDESAFEVIDDTVDGSIIASSCTGTYVRIDGRFREVMNGAWAIVELEEIIKLDDISTCWKRT